MYIESTSAMEFILVLYVCIFLAIYMLLNLKDIVIVTVIVLFCIGLVVLLIDFIIKLIKDILLLKKIKQQFTNQWSRNDIEKLFHEFNLELFRYKFIKRLKDDQVVPRGEWTNNKVPYIVLDSKISSRSSVLLAQLEERWRNLN